MGLSRKSSELLTLAHVPTQVPETVKGMERERRGENELCGVLECIRNASNEVNDVGRVKGGGRNKVGECVAVEDCKENSTVR